MRKKRIWILLGGIVLISSAFLLLNFRVAEGNTRIMKKVVTMGANAPDLMQRNNKLNVVLVGDGLLISALQKALTEKMDEAGMRETELVLEPELAYQDPVLVVKVGRPDPIWTPFFAMSQFSVHAGYASDGDTTFMEGIEETQTSIGNQDHSILNMYAEYEVNDRSVGLISRLGYHQFLADYLAQEIVTALVDLYNR